MTSEPGKGRVGHLDLAALRSLSRHRVRRALAVILGICPPFICAWLAEGNGRWDLFERSGSITTSVGLLLASRPYIQHSIHELVVLHMKGELPSEFQEDVFSGKFGLALSAVGTVIWGWGAYLGWWSFGSLVFWAVLGLRDARRDFIIKTRPTQPPAPV
ncbi:MAG: hypothetical protein JOY66_06740 [Acetobacteraceae bacterium]|nr:hypothetical protein [Acetobacteraceae bacterium]